MATDKELTPEEIQRLNEKRIADVKDALKRGGKPYTHARERKDTDKK